MISRIYLADLAAHCITPYQ